MADSMIVYKCPCCGADIQYAAGTDKLKCMYCDNEYEISTLQGYEEGLSQQKPENFSWKTYDERSGNGDWSEGELSSLKSFKCSHCGGEIIGDGSTMASTCPYCDNPVVMNEAVEGVLRPDFVIPFKVDRSKVEQAYANFIKGKPLLPKSFRSENRIQNIKGIYVPFWLFDANSTGDAHYKGTKVKHWSDSKYIYTKTEHYSIVRAGVMSFEKVPVDGSTKMDDALMESLEPFHYDEAVDFSTAYLAGFFADRYDVDVAHSIDRANARIKNSTDEVLKSTVKGYMKVVNENVNVQINEGEIRYALMPVWICNTEYKGENYMFAVNGQTGKTVGNLPIDKMKKLLFGAAAMAVSFAAVFSFITFLL